VLAFQYYHWKTTLNRLDIQDV